MNNEASQLLPGSVEAEVPFSVRHFEDSSLMASGMQSQYSPVGLMEYSRRRQFRTASVA
jgi:hypothetical protein